jgi:hypothetical protein
MQELTQWPFQTLNLPAAHGTHHQIKLLFVFALRAKNEQQKEGKVPLRMTTYGHRVSPVNDVSMLRQ